MLSTQTVCEFVWLVETEFSKSYGFLTHYIPTNIVPSTSNPFYWSMLNQDWTNEWHMDLSWNLGSPMRQTWMLYDISIVRCIKSNSARKFWLTLYNYNRRLLKTVERRMKLSYHPMSNARKRGVENWSQSHISKLSSIQWPNIPQRTHFYWRSD